MGQWYVSVLLELDFDVLLPPLQHSKIIFFCAQAGIVGEVTLVVSVVVVVAAEGVMLAVLREGGGQQQVEAMWRWLVSRVSIEYIITRVS